MYFRICFSQSSPSQAQETFGPAFTYAIPRGLFSDSNDSDSDGAPARPSDPGWPQAQSASLCSLQLG